MAASSYAAIAGDDPDRSGWSPNALGKYPNARRGTESMRNPPMLYQARENMRQPPMLYRENMRQPPMLYQARENMRQPPMLYQARESFAPESPQRQYPDDYYVYRPYISPKNTSHHLNPPVSYPSIARNILPGTTTRYSQVVYDQPYWYRHTLPASYAETWDYNIELQREYQTSLSRARRMRHLQ